MTITNTLAYYDREIITNVKCFIVQAQVLRFGQTEKMFCWHQSLVNRQTQRQKKRQSERQTEGQTDRRTNGWTKEQIDGQTDRQTDKFTD